MKLSSGLIILVSFLTISGTAHAKTSKKLSRQFSEIAELSSSISASKYEQIELDIEEKLSNIKSLLEKENFGPALLEAKKVREGVREKLMREPKAKDQKIEIQVKNIGKFKNKNDVIFNYLGGYFVDLLNLYKRVEMFYTYAFVKRLTNGGSLEERDIEILTDTLVKVYDVRILIIDEKTDSTSIIFESDVVDEHTNYLFQREVDMYFRDLNLNEGESNTLLSLAEESKKKFKDDILTEHKSEIKKDCVTRISRKTKIGHSEIDSICSRSTRTSMSKCMLSELQSELKVKIGRDKRYHTYRGTKYLAPAVTYSYSYRGSSSEYHWHYVYDVHPVKEPLLSKKEQLERVLSYGIETQIVNYCKFEQ